MEKARLPVDFNEMIDCDTIMLSQSDQKNRLAGKHHGFAVLIPTAFRIDLN